MSPRDRFLAIAVCGSGALSLAIAVALLARGVSATGVLVATQLVFGALLVILRQLTT